MTRFLTQVMRLGAATLAIILCLNLSILAVLGDSSEQVSPRINSSENGSGNITPGLPDGAAWTVERMMQLKRISDVRVSPDGSQVVYSVMSADLSDGKSRFVSRLYVARADGSGSYQLTSDDFSGSPQWSPDGKWIAFTSARSGKPNIWLIHPGGGEAEQLTDTATGVQLFRWSPDGSQIAFTMTDPPTEQDQKAIKEKDDAQVVDTDSHLAQLWVISTQTGKGLRIARRLTEGRFTVGLPIGSAFDWSPDGRTIAFTHAPSTIVNDWHRATISTVDLDSGEITAVDGPKEKMSPVYSPDGKWLAFESIGDGSIWPFDFHVFVVPAKGGEPRQLSNTFDSFPILAGWAADSKSLYFTESHGTLNHLYSMPLDGSAPRQIDNGQGVMGEVEINDSRLTACFAMQTMDKPAEAYCTQLDNWQPHQVSSVNAEIAAEPVAETKLINWASDGVKIEGLLTYPAEYKAGTKYPLLVIAHGGPDETFQQTFIGDTSPYPVAVFAQRGFAVLRCNVRGSGGYGKEFRYKDRQDWGGRDYRDLMAGVDRVIEMGVADPNRLGIMGWSYGGYLSAAAITQTRRFRAASIGAAVLDLVSFAGTTDIPDFTVGYFGKFVDNPALYQDHSPVYHAKGVTAATLFQYDALDKRSPIAQGMELYRALKAQGVTTEMVVYPRSGHAITEPRLIMDAAERNLSWFEKYTVLRD